MLEEPVFLVGAERSGTTLLRLMLDSHPEIAFCEEFEYAVDLVGEDGSYPDMAAYERYLAYHRIFATSGFELDATTSYPELVDGFLASRQAASGSRYVGATIHFGFSKALKIWPKAKLVHIIRDPRDVSPSVVAMGWAGNVWFGLDKWIEAEDEWDRIEPELDASRKLTVSFADLVADHERTLSTVCEFIGTSYSPLMLNYATETDYEVPKPGVASDWTTRMADGDVQLIEARVGDRMESLGFELSGLPRIEVGQVRRQWLSVTNRVQRLRARIEIFGIRLTVLELLARATRNEEWQRSLYAQFNEISTLRLKKSWSDDSATRTSR